MNEKDKQLLVGVFCGSTLGAIYGLIEGKRQERERHRKAEIAEKITELEAEVLEDNE